MFKKTYEVEQGKNKKILRITVTANEPSDEAIKRYANKTKELIILHRKVVA